MVVTSVEGVAKSKANVCLRRCFKPKCSINICDPPYFAADLIYRVILKNLQQFKI